MTVNIYGPTIAVNEIYLWMLIEVCHGCTDSIRHDPDVIGIEPSEDLTTTDLKSFVDGVGMPIVSLRYELHPTFVSLDNFTAAIARPTINDDTLNIGILLLHHAFDRRRDKMSPIQTGDDDGDERCFSHRALFSSYDCLGKVSLAKPQLERQQFDSTDAEAPFFGKTNLASRRAVMSIIADYQSAG